MLNTSTITASDARANLYNLIKEASGGLKSFEITLRDSEPVMLISKAELESWMETLDVLNSPQELKSLKSTSKKLISHKDLKKSLSI